MDLKSHLIIWGLLVINCQSWKIIKNFFWGTVSHPPWRSFGIPWRRDAEGMEKGCRRDGEQCRCTADTVKPWGVLKLPLGAPGAAEIPSPAVKICVPSALQGRGCKGVWARCAPASFFTGHRRVWIAGDIKDHLVPSPCCGQGSHPLNQAPESPTQPGLASPLSSSFYSPLHMQNCTGLLFRTSHLVPVISRTHIPQCTIRQPPRKPNPQK